MSVAAWLWRGESSSEGDVHGLVLLAAALGLPLLRWAQPLLVHSLQTAAWSLSKQPGGAVPATAKCTETCIMAMKACL